MQESRGVWEEQNKINQIQSKNSYWLENDFLLFRGPDVFSSDLIIFCSKGLLNINVNLCKTMQDYTRM